ncbi:MAG: hypothetical protein WCK42_03190 [Myxococcaceae bacterium]
MYIQTIFFSFLLSSFSFAIDAPGFRHSGNSALSWFAPHHSASDVLTVSGREAALNAKFSYGPMHKDLEDEDIQLWLGTCENKLVSLGIFKTDSDGRLLTTLSGINKTGTYKICMLVSGDNTSTEFTLRILDPNTRLAIFDLDGTLTRGNIDFRPREGAPEITQVLKISGLEIIYLSGRHYFLTRMTRNLLSDNGFAEGSLIVGQSLHDIVPIESNVGIFKENYLKYLKDLGLILDRAYGDSKTDIYAYQEVQIPNTQIFTLGENSGYKGSTGLGEDYLQHLQDLARLPK